MPRRAARTDANHAAIVDALRACGATVQSLAAVGEGCPDLLVGYRSRNVLLEVKNGLSAPSRRQLTDDQKDWHAAWKGRAHVVKTIEEALFAVGVNEWKRDQMCDTLKVIAKR